MADTNIAFANIVPNTSPASWSQAYNAGKLFAVLSLQREAKEGMDDGELSVLGKEVISTFEQEFFTLENKDLEGVKNAIHRAIEKIAHLPSYSFVITYISGSVLYVFIAGGGSVILKRGSKIGTILEAEEIGSEIKSASGFLQNDDLIVLQTKSFSKIINIQTLAGALDQENPEKIAEELAPKIHEKQDGSASSIVLFYKDEKAVETLQAVKDELPAKEEVPASAAFDAAKSDNFEEISLDNLEKPPEPPLSELVLNAEEEDENKPFTQETKRSRPRFSLPIGAIFSKINLSSLNHRRRLLLTVAAVIILILGASIFFGLRNRDNQANQQAFAGIYPKALDKYNEGKSLADLNESLARQNFEEAQKILSENKDRFKEGSSEDGQIEDLLSKVNSELGGRSGTSDTGLAQAKSVSKDLSEMLSVELNNTGVTHFTKDPTYVYFIDGAGVQRVNKETSDKTQIIAKNWAMPSGVGVFSGNLYVLDKEVSEIFKFTPPATGSAYTKSAYLTKGTTPDFTKAVSMAIDGSIYVLTSDGKVLKFLRGASSSFSITGLSKPLLKPTKIYTIEDFTNIYILDRGNSRIVVLNKTGGFVSQYQASVLKDARDFEVVEADKKIFILSGGKVYQIDLK